MRALNLLSVSPVVGHLTRSRYCMDCITNLTIIPPKRAGVKFSGHKAAGYRPVVILYSRKRSILLSKDAVIKVFLSIRSGASVTETKKSTDNSERTVRRYRRVLSGFERGQSDFEIRNAADNWVEPSIASMRRWAVEEGIISSDLLDPESIKQSAEVAHLEALVEFAGTISDSLDIPLPTVTAVSGFGEGHWADPFAELLGEKPSLRVIESAGGTQNFSALREHMPRNDPNSKIEVILSLLETYAHAANQLGEFVRRLLIDRVLFDDPKSVPDGLILATLYFGVEDASTGKSSEIVPVVEQRPNGSFVVRIGGWAPSLESSDTAEAMVRNFGEMTKEISKLPETDSLIEIMSDYEDLVEKIQRQLTPKNKIRITLSKTSCALCI